MLIELAEAYVKALNGGKVPTIENAWNYMQGAELERAFKETVQDLEKSVQSWVLPIADDKLREAGAKLKGDLVASFKSKVLGDINNSKGLEYLQKLKKELKQRMDQVKKKNAQVAKEQCL